MGHLILGNLKKGGTKAPHPSKPLTWLGFKKGGRKLENREEGGKISLYRIYCLSRNFGEKSLFLETSISPSKSKFCLGGWLRNAHAGIHRRRKFCGACEKRVKQSTESSVWVVWDK